MRAPVANMSSTMSAWSPVCRGPGLPGTGCCQLWIAAHGLHVLVGEDDGLAAGFTQPTGVTDGVGRDRAVAYGEGEHLAEDARPHQYLICVG
jgi:hypothetical protein